MPEPLRILLASSEVAGFAKTGGLADVCAALPRAFASRGHSVAVIMPLYRSVRKRKFALTATPHTLAIPMGKRTMPARIWEARLADTDVPVYFVDQPEYFDRDDPDLGRGIYQFALPSGHKRDYPDNGERFAFFARCVLEAMPRLGFAADVLHLNDWQTGLVPVYLRDVYARRSTFPYRAMRTLFTIHNIAYQGSFRPADVLPASGLDPRLFNYRELEFYGNVNFLKAGLVFADKLNTVSPTYAREVQTSLFGCGLQGVLSERRHDLTGIVNGVDYRQWCPATDPHIARQYDIDSVDLGKQACKADLQARFGLDPSPAAPILGMVARLVEQKGIDLVIRAAERLFTEDHAQIVILGEGDPEYHGKLLQLHDRFPKQLGLYIGFNESLAHQIEAGSDLFLMPSLFEPSGLNQLYSLRYGTPPIVKATGGLADTITDSNATTLAAGTANGFTFQAHTGTMLVETIRRALAIQRDEPTVWKHIQRTGMEQDWSWERSATMYEDLFRAMHEFV